MKLPNPDSRGIIYEDNKLYAVLASHPIARGHVVIVWKKKVSDIHLLSRKNFEWLMDKVDDVRSAMLKALKLGKVYLFYMDEVSQVHWHLIPRYNEKGFNILRHKPGRLMDFSIATKIKKYLK